jgi:hypothetical protein
MRHKTKIIPTRKKKPEIKLEEDDIVAESQRSLKA